MEKKINDYIPNAHPTKCETQKAVSFDLASGPSIVEKNMKEPPVLGRPEASAKPKLTLLDKPAYDFLKKPGDVTELRILGVSGNSRAWNGFARGTVTGLFDNHEGLCKAIISLQKIPYKGVYFTPQVIDPRLIGRAYNRLVAAEKTTSDYDVLAFRFLLVDVDPVRPSGISSSDAELSAALKLRNEIAGEISSDYSLPEPVRAVSGNGGHLLYLLPDMPVVEYASVIKNITEEISADYSTDKVLIDSKVFNPARIWRAYGTIARKGDAVPDSPYREARPHRLAFIDHLPAHEVKE